MQRSKLTFIAGVITILVAVLSVNSYVSPTGAVVSTSTSIGSLTVGVLTVIIAVSLFARYFGLMQ
jgi:uncharacterized membrane protein